MPHGTTGAFRQHIDRQIFVQVSGNPRDDVGKAIGRLRLKPERLGILFLLARPFHIHDKLARDGKGEPGTVIFLDEGEREIYDPLAQELAHQQQLWERQRRDHRAVQETVNIDKLDEAARQSDVAAQQSRTKRRE